MTTAKPHSRVMVRMPGHPRANTQGAVPRAWLAMEKMIGRPVSKGEVVHHEDENPRNDAAENLRLFPSQAAHCAYHSKKIAQHLGSTGRRERARRAWADMPEEERRQRGVLGGARIRCYASHPGEANGACKLTPEIVLTIRHEARGSSYAALARKYGLSLGHARRIVLRESWKHI